MSLYLTYHQNTICQVWPNIWASPSRQRSEGRLHGCQSAYSIHIMYDTMSYKTFCKMLYQYDIHIIVSRKTFHTTTIYIVFSPGVESAQLSVKTGHCTVWSRDLNEWQVASVHSALVVLLSPPSYTNLVSSWRSHWGERVLIVRNDSYSKPLFRNPTFSYTMFLHMTFKLQFFII